MFSCKVQYAPFIRAFTKRYENARPQKLLRMPIAALIPKANS